jgi:hypothetical protein
MEVIFCELPYQYTEVNPMDFNITNSTHTMSGKMSLSKLNISNYFEHSR